MIRDKACQEAQALPVGERALAPMDPERCSQSVLVLHPSVFLIASRFPIVTIWESKNGERDGMIERWSAESALVACPLAEAEVRRLPSGGFAFISALSQGRAVAGAIDAGIAAAPNFDIAANLAFLLEARIVIDVRAPTVASYVAKGGQS